MIWDTSGLERFRAITLPYYCGPDGEIIFFDVTDEESFNNVERIWIPMFQQYSRSSCVAIVVGMKSYLEKKKSCKYRKSTDIVR